MNTVTIRRDVDQIVSNLTFSKPLLLLFVVVLLFTDKTRDVVFTNLSDAYFQVSVFVAATLLALLSFERIGNYRLAHLLARHKKWQVLCAAMLGAIPGCGGAIIVVTQYVNRSMSFGGVVATLTATMGDAAFLLLAKEPMIALIVFAVCFITGTLFGYLVDVIHGRHFMQVHLDDTVQGDLVEENELLSPLYKVWMFLFIPGAIIGVLSAAQIDISAITLFNGAEWVTPLGTICALIAIVMWTLNPLSDIRLCFSEGRSLSRRVVDTTNFITFWVICGFIGYGLFELFFAFNIAATFNTWLYWLPLIAVLVGFIPGCGPQIIVTTLFLNGVIPLSAQIANAISNDGDALFPAVAVAPRAAIVATLYTAIPALVIGYCWLFFLE